MTALLALELSFHELGMRVMQVATLLVLEMPLRELHMEVLRSLVGFATQEAMATLIGTRMAAGVCSASSSATLPQPRRMAPCRRPVLSRGLRGISHVPRRRLPMRYAVLAARILTCESYTLMLVLLDSLQFATSFSLARLMVSSCSRSCVPSGYWRQSDTILRGCRASMRLRRGGGAGLSMAVSFDLCLAFLAL